MNILESFDFGPALLIGIIYGLSTIGLSLTYRFLKFPDFTLLGSIAVGSLASVAYLENLGTVSVIDIFISLLLGCFWGGVLGLITSLQILYARIPNLLAGIITFTSYLTFAKMITGGKEPISPLSRDAYSWFLTSSYSHHNLLIYVIIVLLVVLLLYFVFKSKFGVFIWSMTANQTYLKFRHRQKNTTTLLLILSSNMIVGLAGALNALQIGSASLDNYYKDFLVIALGSFSLTHALIITLRKKSIRNYSKKTGEATQGYAFKIFRLVQRFLLLNEEKPQRYFATCILYVIISCFINQLFHAVSINFTNESEKYQFLCKGLLLFFSVLLSVRVHEELASEN